MGRWTRSGTQSPRRTTAPLASGPLMEPTPEDIRNGWTAETLTAYHAERKRANDGVIARNPEYRRPEKPQKANSKYKPLRRFR